ncbi:KH domain-containing protein HEN4 isoform X1 [Magnolia sinica]|uniref:KH domain-containing protein HEN4 isoform X1 n=1 Tax=Magnolia sinica TaxID=86752 RepID=UPI002659D1C9|nr:KH domain-containing protein HEN4 isoform X1 [Magnolia sinica]XP_058068131.1 KH domain-containing protein HEN4 isoform X1 [Magnolia sinica]
MEGTSVIPPAKRLFDPSTTVRSESNDQNSGRSSKRRSTSSFKSPPLPLTPSSGETLFRILCPSSKTGALIGKSGSIIRRFRSATRAKIRIDDPVPASDERVILIVAPSASTPSAQDDEAGDKAEVVASPAQRALVMLFDRMVEVDEEEKDRVAEAVNKGIVVCRLLAPSNQVGCVLGKGGKIVEKIREESGAQVRVLAKDQIPGCAAVGDELIQITGSVSSVRKALLSVSSCLQDNPRSDATNFVGAKSLGVMLRGAGPAAQVDPFPQRGYVPSPRALDYHSRGYSSVPGPDSAALGHRQVLEEEVVFRLLCSNDKVGSLIGKGGTIVRGLQNETGASIKVLESVSDSEERVVVISTLENSELKRSPAQDAVIRVHSRIAETGAEKGVAFAARLLVPSQQIGCLLGKGGSIIAEMRRASGASIKILVNEQVPICAMPNDEVVQVNGSLQSVQDALFHITSRLREMVFPMKTHPSVGLGEYLSAASELPPIIFRQRHELISPGRYPSLRPHGLDRSTSLPHTMDRQPAPSHGIDHLGGHANVDRVPYHYGGERSGYGPAFDHPSPPRSWAPQSTNGENPRGIADIETGLATRSGPIGSGSQATAVTSTTVEVVVPRTLLRFIYGENGSSLNHIRKISGATVTIHDPRPAATEGTVVISGTPDQAHVAQTLLQAFILCGQTTP